MLSYIALHDDSSQCIAMLRERNLIKLFLFRAELLYMRREVAEEPAWPLYPPQSSSSAASATAGGLRRCTHGHFRPTAASRGGHQAGLRSQPSVALCWWEAVVLDALERANRSRADTLPVGGAWLHPLAPGDLPLAAARGAHPGGGSTDRCAPSTFQQMLASRAIHISRWPRRDLLRGLMKSREVPKCLFPRWP